MDSDGAPVQEVLDNHREAGKAAPHALRLCEMVRSLGHEKQQCPLSGVAFAMYWAGFAHLLGLCTETKASLFRADADMLSQTHVMESTGSFVTTVSCLCPMQLLAATSERAPLAPEVQSGMLHEAWLPYLLAECH